MAQKRDKRINEIQRELDELKGTVNEQGKKVNAQETRLNEHALKFDKVEEELGNIKHQVILQAEEAKKIVEQNLSLIKKRKFRMCENDDRNF